MKFLYHLAASDLKIPAQEILLPKLAADNNQFNQILTLVYTLIAAVALFYIVRGALLFVTHGSEPSDVKAARETILYAAVALILSSLVFVLLQFVIKSLS